VSYRGFFQDGKFNGSGVLMNKSLNITKKGNFLDGELNGFGEL